MGDSTENTSFARLVIESIPKPDPRPSKLHHYTNFNTAKEILLSNTLHLSHAAFSNDPTELSHGLDVMKKIFGESAQGAFDTDLFLSHLYYRTQPYIFCLSESEDMLSQWEMYSGRNGCCITFNNNEINRLTEEPYVGLAPVIYEEAEQLKYLEGLNTQRRQPEYSEQEQSSNNLYFFVSTVFLKNPAWSHEKEWRIVKIIQEESFSDIQYRSGSRFLKPYVRLSCEPLPITEIRVGPADDQDRLVRSMEHLVKMTKGYEDVAISRSTVRVSPS